MKGNMGRGQAQDSGLPRCRVHSAVAGTMHMLTLIALDSTHTSETIRDSIVGEHLERADRLHYPVEQRKAYHVHM